MKMIEIAALDNGAHNNQTYNGTLLEGWALVVADTDTLENFPYGSFEVVYENGIPYMDPATWTPGTIPEPEPVEPVVPTPSGPTLPERVTELESENAMLKAQINAQSEQMDFYEDCIAEMAMIVYA